MSDLILDVTTRSAEELIKHSKGPGIRYVFSDHNNNPEGSIYVIARVVEDVSNSAHVEPHTHDCESLFIFKGSNADLSGLEAEVLLDNQWYGIISPRTVRIPAGVRHTYRFIKGSGEFWNIVLTPGADYNLTVK